MVFVGGDQSQLAGPIGDLAFQTLVHAALANAPVVMTDGTMTAAMGAWYSANPDPTEDDYQDVGIASFLAGNIDVQPGLVIISGVSFEPLLTWDQRWGRIYSLSRAHPDNIIFGLSEVTALVLDDSGAHVEGERSVVALDGRRATFRDGTNDAFSALNVVMDIFSVGDAVGK